MIIGIDARLYGSMDRGIGRYAQELIRALVAHSQRRDTYHVIVPERELQAARKEQPSVLWRGVSWPVYSWKEQILGAWLWIRWRGDCIHFTHWNVPVAYMMYAFVSRKRFIVTIHDLILRKSGSRESTTRRAAFFWVKYLAYRLTLWLVMRTASGIIVVSNAVADDIKMFYPRHPPLRVIYEGADHCPLDHGRDPRKPWIISVGSAYPHKNLLGMLRGFARFYHAGHESWRFIVCSRRSVFLDRIQRQATAEHLMEGVEWRMAVDDEALWTLYSQSSILLLASLDEGFGFPPLEAMRSGLIVVASDHPVIHEMAGDGALFVDPRNPEDIASRLSLVASGGNSVDELRQRAHQRVTMFTWSGCAGATRQSYERYCIL